MKEHGQSIIKEILRALIEFQSQDYCFNNLNPKTIIVTGDYQHIKVIDFAKVNVRERGARKVTGLYAPHSCFTMR